jgi:hypothetical protein
MAGERVKSRNTRAVVFAVLAAAIAMLTPIVRLTPLLNWLPDPLEWYFRPSPTRTNFTLFPWAGFVFAGAVAGTVVESMRRAEHPVRRQLALAAASILLAAAGYRAAFLPSIYPQSEFWTSSPTFFLIRAGLDQPGAAAGVSVGTGALEGHGEPLEPAGGVRKVLPLRVLGSRGDGLRGHCQAPQSGT